MATDTFPIQNIISDHNFTPTMQLLNKIQRKYQRIRPLCVDLVRDVVKVQGQELYIPCLISQIQVWYDVET